MPGTKKLPLPRCNAKGAKGTNNSGGCAVSQYIAEVFGDKGLLSRRFENYSPRSGQIEMAEGVDTALAQGTNLMVEAPTGTGKSLAFGVPLIHHATRKGRKAVIVTSNITLQEQLVGKDLPLLQSVLPWNFSFALLKGKGNYVCLQQLAEIKDKGTKFKLTRADSLMLKRLVQWAETSPTGDKSELPFEPSSELWNLFSCKNEDCLGNKCSLKGRCRFQRAKALASNANVIVVNYHLLCAHMKVLGQSGKDLVLPHFDYVVLDEAHKAAETARNFFAHRVTLKAVKNAAGGLKDINKRALHKMLVDEAECFFQKLEAYRRSSAYERRIKEVDAVPWQRLARLLESAGKAYGLAESRSRETKTKEKLLRAKGRCMGLAERLEKCMHSHVKSTNRAVSVEWGKKSVELCSKLVSVAYPFSKFLFEKVRSATLTSATLRVGGSYHFHQNELGLVQTDYLNVLSPFDILGRSMLIVPENMPLPSEPEYKAAVGEAVSEIVDLAGGRTLALFTSWDRLNSTYERLKDKPFKILKQGDKPRSALIREFREDVSSVLLGTESFWAGVDVPGESLVCVVIDRLPFPLPNDPILDAMNRPGKNSFVDYSVPKAITALKQGVGRLIRDKNDYGVVVVLDRRLETASFGKRFSQSLPFMQKGDSLACVKSFLDSFDCKNRDLLGFWQGPARHETFNTNPVA